MDHDFKPGDRVHVYSVYGHPEYSGSEGYVSYVLPEKGIVHINQPPYDLRPAIDRFCPLDEAIRTGWQQIFFDTVGTCDLSQLPSSMSVWAKQYQDKFLNEYILRKILTQYASGFRVRNFDLF